MLPYPVNLRRGSLLLMWYGPMYNQLCREWAILIRTTQVHLLAVGSAVCVNTAGQESSAGASFFN